MNALNQNQESLALASIRRGLAEISPALWIANRQKALNQEAGAMSVGLNVSKAVSLSGVAVAGGIGLFFGGAGVAIVGGGLAAAGYVASLIADGLDTGSFAPIPWMRTRVTERLELLGNAESRELRSQWENAQAGAGYRRLDAAQELYSHLPVELRNEALMLMSHGPLIASLLGQLPAEQRDLAYLHICTMYSQFGDALTGLSAARLRDSIAGQVSGDYTRMQPAEIGQYQAPVYQMPATAPVANFGALPVSTQAPIQESEQLPARTIVPSPVAAKTLVDDLSVETLKALKEYVRQPKNIVMVASGGAGKGLTLSNLCRFRHEADTTFRAIWFDPKNDPDEAGYMDYAAITPIRFTAVKLPAEVVVQKVRDMMNTFKNMCHQLPPKTPVWLILDEWWFVLSVLQQHDADALAEVIGMLRSTVSLLDAEHKHIVLVGQSPNLNDLLPGQGGLMANFNTLCLFKKDSNGIKLMEKAGQSGVMPRKLATAQRLYSAAAQSPRDRAMFFGDRLWPTPELPNYGNYDRDKKQHLGKAPVLLAETARPVEAEIEEFDPTDVVQTPETVELLNRAYSATADKPSDQPHPKAQRFAEVVQEWFEKHPDKPSVGLGAIIQSNRKLKDRGVTSRAAIEKLMHLASDAGLICIEETKGSWSISLPCTSEGDELNFDF